MRRKVVAGAVGALLLAGVVRAATPHPQQAVRPPNPVIATVTSLPLSAGSSAGVPAHPAGLPSVPATTAPPAPPTGLPSVPATRVPATAIAPTRAATPVTSAPVVAARCADFPNQAAAQAAYRANPAGLAALDTDHDGVACESLRAPRDTVPVRR